MAVEFNNTMYCAIDNQIKKLVKGRWHKVASLPRSITDLVALENHLYIAVGNGITRY